MSLPELTSTDAIADTTSAVTLHQHAPAYELQAYMRLVGVAYSVINSPHPVYASTGELPQLQQGSVLVGGRRCFAAVRRLGSPAADAAMSEEEIADLTGWMAVVHNSLTDVLLLTSSFGRDRSSARYPWGLWLLLERMAALFDDTSASADSRASTFLSVRGLDDLGWAEQIAGVAYYRLGLRYSQRAHADRSPWFFPQGPSSLDAVVFGHLASARACPVMSRIARKHALPALGQHFAAFATHYFADDRVLGAKPFRSLTWHTEPTEAAPVCADSIGETARPEASAAGPGKLLLSVTGRNAFRERELSWLQTLVEAREARDEARDEAAASDAASNTTPTAADVPAARPLADFPLGFGEEPGLLGNGAGSLVAQHAAAGRPRAAFQGAGAGLNALVTFGILAIGAGVAILASRPRAAASAAATAVGARS